MSVSPISATDPSQSVTSAIQSSGQLGQQQFLQLLVTQLTNQDPMQPQDQSAFLAQLAQFSTVEGVNNMASAQSKLSASGLLGKTVDAQVVTNGVGTALTGQVTAVRYDANGVYLEVGSPSTEITLDQVQQVHN
jgi:flagellar basal-body rod modification protein FlgD